MLLDPIYLVLDVLDLRLEFHQQPIIRLVDHHSNSFHLIKYGVAGADDLANGAVEAVVF